MDSRTSWIVLRSIHGCRTFVTYIYNRSIHNMNHVKAINDQRSTPKRDVQKTHHLKTHIDLPPVHHAPYTGNFTPCASHTSHCSFYFLCISHLTLLILLSVLLTPRTVPFTLCASQTSYFSFYSLCITNLILLILLPVHHTPHTGYFTPSESYVHTILLLPVPHTPHTAYFTPQLVVFQ